jgi:chromosome segregation ATPase
MSMFADMTLQELNALAERQRRQIEEQEKSLQMKQKKLTILNQQQQQNNSASDDRLRKLRERAIEQENRLKHFRMTGDQNTALLSAELTAVRDLLESKQRELNQSILKVDKITQGLSELQKTQESSASGEIGKLNRELGALHNLNSEQSKKLQSQRELLRRKQNESAELDRKILDLADRINKKKMAQQHQGNVYTNVAPVKPVVQDKLQVQYTRLIY